MDVLHKQKHRSFRLDLRCGCFALYRPAFCGVGVPASGDHHRHRGHFVHKVGEWVAYLCLESSRSVAADSSALVSHGRIAGKAAGALSANKKAVAAGATACMLFYEK